MQDVDLSLEFAGVELSSPFGVAAIGHPCAKKSVVTPEMHAGTYIKHIDAGAGYVYVSEGVYIPEDTLKEIERDYEIKESPKVSSRRYMRIGSPNDESAGLYYAAGPFLIFNPRKYTESFQNKVEQIRIIREKRPEAKIFVNIFGIGDITETYVSSAIKSEEVGADLLEINFSCPMPAARDGAVDEYFAEEFSPFFMGCMVGDLPNHVEKITREVCKAVKIPVGVKLTPEIGFPRVIDFARRTQKAGAEFIQVVNLGLAIAPPDIYNGGKPTWPLMNGSPITGASGNWLRIPCYKDVALIAKFVPGLEIAASGGLMKPEHSVEVMMLGAKLPQLCTAVLYRGRKIITQNVNFLKKFLKDNGYGSIEEIVGLGVNYIKNAEDVEFYPDMVVAETDVSRCTGCGICSDSICLASGMEDGVSVVLEENCNGCGMCVAVCPEDARTLKMLQ